MTNQDDPPKSSALYHKALTWAFPTIIVLLIVVRSPFEAQGNVLLQLQGQTAVVTFAIPNAYLESSTRTPDGRTDTIWLALAYPSMKATGAPGTSADRSVIIFHIGESRLGGDPKGFIPREIAADWLPLPSEHPGLLHFISKVYAQWKQDGRPFYNDIYIPDRPLKDFYVTCLHERGNDATGCKLSERVDDNLELVIQFPMRELPSLFSIENEVKQFTLSLIVNREFNRSTRGR